MDFIFDVDGTLADAGHRIHHITVKPYDWNKFRELAAIDLPIEPVAVLARSLGTLCHRLVMATGRDETQREQTEAWLARHRIPCERLYMRALGDFRKDAVVKGEMLDRILADGYRPKMVFEDRRQCVEMWRARGLICLQVAPGDF